MASGKVHIIYRTYANESFSSCGDDFKIRDTYELGDIEIIVFRDNRATMSSVVAYEDGSAVWEGSGNTLAFSNSEEYNCKVIPHTKLGRSLYKNQIIMETEKWMVVKN